MGMFLSFQYPDRDPRRDDGQLPAQALKARRGEEPFPRASSRERSCDETLEPR